jgi:endonuclease/exonuclease/phosphatase family metal-dependent hydrolase
MLKHLESKKLFTFYNVHFDYLTPEIRLVQAKELFERIVEADERYKTPFLVLGDFNAKPHEETINYFNNNAPLKMTDLTDKFDFTFAGHIITLGKFT